MLLTIYTYSAVTISTYHFGTISLGRINPTLNSDFMSFRINTGIFTAMHYILHLFNYVYHAIMVNSKFPLELQNTYRETYYSDKLTYQFNPVMKNKNVLPNLKSKSVEQNLNVTVR